MRPTRTTLFLILLSYSVLIQNYRPVSGSWIALGATASGGLFIWRRIVRGFNQIGYFLASGPYGYYVKWKKYENFATIDDIVDEKYVDLNLASKRHSDFITVTKLPDDEENQRRNLVYYQVEAHKFEKFPKHLTLGRVRFYKRKLQGNLKYHYRTVLTYTDQMNRKCIQIESFNDTGNRIMKRIYRERSCFWWYDLIIDDKQTFLQKLNPLRFFTSSSATTYSLNLNYSVLPPFIAKVIFSHGYYFFVQKTGGSIGQITEILFANQPIKPEGRIDDLLIWHYIEQMGETVGTSFVVLCQLLNRSWSCKYYKCMSEVNREFKVYDSFSIPLDDNITFANKDASSRPVNKLGLRFDLTSKNVPDNVDKFSLNLYPQTNHYTLRPRDLNTVNMMDTVDTKDARGPANISHKTENNFRFASVKKYDDFYHISFTALDSTNLMFNTANLKETDHNSVESFHEIGTRAYLDGMLSPYYIRLPILGKTITSDSLDLDLTRQEGVLTAKLNDNVTFYASLYSKFSILKKLKLEASSFDIKFDVNSQVFYCETGVDKFVVVSHSNGDPTVFKKDKSSYKQVNINDMQQEISDVKLSEILNADVDKSWTGVVLNLNDVYLSEGIEILVPSYNTVTFRTFYGKRIAKIFWKDFEINIKSGWALVSKIMYMEHHLLLIDTVLRDEIHRELYMLDLDNSKIRLMSNLKLKFSSNNLDKLSEDLHKSLHDLYPNNLPVKVFFENPKTDISAFDIDEINIAHSDSDLFFSPGDLTVHGRDYRVLKNHKWKQVFRHKSASNTSSYSIFTLSNTGMYYYYSSPDEETRDEYLREPFHTIKGQAVPLLVESVYCPGIKVETTKIGKNQITTYRSEETSKVLNPIIFGKHEIKLVGPIKKVEVTKSFNDQNLCSISIEAHFQNNEKGTLTFTQIKENSDEYELKGSEKLNFVDDSIDISDLTEYQIDQDLMDFNSNLFPQDLRYMILNDVYYYFTGYTRYGIFKIRFGEQIYELPAKTRYNIWIRYPYENVKSVAFFLSYKDKHSMHTKSHVHDNADSEHKIKRPNVKFNWGILSNIEALVVNRNLLSMAAHSEDFFPIDLKIGEGVIDKVIMQLKIDNDTSVYTTLSKSKCVINDVRYKNVVIKGVEKQIAKQVFFSNVANEIVIVVATRTISKVLVNGYVLKNNSFDMVDVGDINCHVHKGLERFQMCKIQAG